LTLLLEGHRLDALAYLKEKNILHWVYADDAHWLRQWRQVDLRQVAFVNPPFDRPPKELRARGDRHLVFDGEAPSAWKKWALKNQVEILNFDFDSAKLVQLLISGKADWGIPPFEPSAAEHFVSAHTGGLEALAAPLKFTACAEYGAPVGFEQIKKQWPFVIVKNKLHRVELGELIKSLGYPKSLKLVEKLNDKECFSALHGVRSATLAALNKSKAISQIVEVTGKKIEQIEPSEIYTLLAISGVKYKNNTCFSGLKKLKLVLSAIENIMHKKLTAKAALFLLCYHLVREKECQSAHRATPSASAALNTQSLLLSIPS
jgi:hypothetical protein